MKVVAITALAFTVAGCGGGLFSKYYSGPDDIKSSQYYDASYKPPNDEVPIYTTNDIQADTLKLMTAGFAPVAESSFYAPDGQVDRDQLEGFAKKIGAHAVLYNSSYRDTISGAVPLILPNNTVSYTNGTATAYGSGGYATAYGNSTTNTYGSQTVMMPYSKSRSNYDAIYFAKVHERLGLLVVPLSDSERQTLGTNRAAKVLVVVEGTPAFNADVLPGDYLQTVNEEVIINQQTLGSALDKYQGQDVTLTLIRDGKSITKKAHIDTIPTPPANPKT